MGQCINIPQIIFTLHAYFDYFNNLPVFRIQVFTDLLNWFWNYCNIMAEGFRFMPLVLTRVRRADVSLRDVAIARDGKRGYTVRVTSRTGSARGNLGDFEKVSELWRDLPRGKTVGFRLLVETFVAGAKRFGGGGHEKARIERMCISLPYVETFNSKVIKGFVPELRSRYVFFEFGDSYVLCDICHICNELRMYISHIPVYGYGTLSVSSNRVKKSIFLRF